MKPRITQRDVARQAGVSHVTVSLALRDSPSIPEKTRNTIKEIALQLGYSPDPMLTALSSYRTQQRPATHQANIGWLYTDRYAPGKGWGDFERYYEGAKARAKELGYILDDINIAGEYADPKRLRRLLEARNITGLVLAPCSTDPSVAHDFEFDLTRYCAVRIGYSYRSPLLNTVANAQFRTVFTAMREVIALGYQRVGAILTHVLDERTSWQFLGGYLAGSHILPRKNWVEPLYVPHHGRDWIPEFFRWVEKQRIDCFVGPGYGFLCPMLIERGVKIPEEIGFADAQLQEGDTYHSGVNQNARQIGISSIEQLVSMMHRHQVGVPKIASHTLIEGSWQANQTTSRRAVPAPAPISSPLN